MGIPARRDADIRAIGAAIKETWGGDTYEVGISHREMAEDLERALQREGFAIVAMPDGYNTPGTLEAVWIDGWRFGRRGTKYASDHRSAVEAFARRLEE